jgi:predicted kinase
MTDDLLTLPRRSLIALCGPAGAGKSTFAHDFIQRNGLPATTVVSSDACRLMLCDDPRSVAPEQWATLQPDTFRLFLGIIDMRMSLGRPVLADTVNLHRDLRQGLLDRSRTRDYPTALIVFDIPLETCLAQNQQRDETRRIPEPAIRQQRQLLDDALPRLAEEGWDHIVVLDERHPTPAIAMNG